MESTNEYKQAKWLKLEMELGVEARCTISNSGNQDHKIHM